MATEHDWETDDEGKPTGRVRQIVAGVPQAWEWDDGQRTLGARARGEVVLSRIELDELVRETNRIVNKAELPPADPARAELVETTKLLRDAIVVMRRQLDDEDVARKKAESRASTQGWLTLVVGLLGVAATIVAALIASG